MFLKCILWVLQCGPCWPLAFLIHLQKDLKGWRRQDKLSSGMPILSQHTRDNSNLFLRGMMPWSTSCSLVLLCCSLSWSTVEGKSWSLLTIIEPNANSSKGTLLVIIKTPTSLSNEKEISYAIECGGHICNLSSQGAEAGGLRQVALSFRTFWTTGETLS